MKNLSFARNRLNVLLRTQAFGAVGAIVPRIMDLFIAGNVVGVDALTAIAAIMPVTIGALFVGKLAYCGSGYLFAKYQGEFRHDRAREVVGMSLELAALVGLGIWAAMFLGRDFYFDLMGLAGTVREQAVSYWRWNAVLVAIYPAAMVMWRLVYADGETVTTSIGDLCQPFFSLAFSIPLTKATESAGGAALGTLISVCLVTLIMMLHLFRKSNAVVPKWCFSRSLAKELVTYALPDSSSRLCQCGFLLVVNFLLVHAGAVRFLPVVSVVALVVEFREMLDKIGDGYTPIAEMYVGEGNRPRLEELMRRGTVVAALTGIVCASLTLVFAPQIVMAYGIPSGEVFGHGVSALRISALSIPFASIMAFLTSHLLVVNRVALSLLGTLLEQFALTAGCAVAFCGLWGVDTLWGGMPLGVLLTLAALALYCKIRDGRVLPEPAFEKGNAILNVSFSPAPERIVKMRNEVETFLSAHGVSRETVGRIALLAEECSMALADRRGRRAKRVVAEVSVTIGAKEVQVVFRDTGETNDVTDGDAPVSSLRAFVIAGLVRVVRGRQYLSTIGCNRAMFTFECAFGRGCGRGAG